MVKELKEIVGCWLRERFNRSFFDFMLNRLYVPFNLHIIKKNSGFAAITYPPIHEF